MQIFELKEEIYKQSVYYLNRLILSSHLKKKNSNLTMRLE